MDKAKRKPVTSTSATAKKSAKKAAPPRGKIISRKCYGTEDLTSLDRLRREHFEADTVRFRDGKRSKDNLIAAVGYWIGYPMFLEIIGHDWHTDSARTDAYYALNFAHTQATHLLMEESEKFGLDPHPLYECARVIQEIYANAPEKYYAGPNDTWPECMGTARYSLPAGQQEALRAGEATFVRLAVKLGLADEKGMAEVAAKVRPALPPRAGLRSNPMSLQELCRQYLNKTQVRADKMKSMFNARDLRREHPKKSLWTICIDGLDPAIQDRLTRKR